MTASSHVELALYADTAIITSSCKLTFLVGYLENRHQRLEELRDYFARAGRPVNLFGEPIQWVATTRYLGMAPDKRLTWSPLID
jgi:hypothetical protein